MQSLTLRRALAGGARASSIRPAPSLANMISYGQLSIGTSQRMNASTTSSPKSAEKASAQSGGSRSKDFAEGENKQSPDPSSSAGASTGNGNESAAPPPLTEDTLASDGAKGRTGGGKPLQSSNSPPPRPKIHNASVPGTNHGGPALTEEQQREVDRHNKEFEKKHDRAAKAQDDKVDPKFWSGGRAGSKEQK